MSVKKVDGFGVRKLGQTTQANVQDDKRFIRVFAYADDGMADASYTINKGDALCMEYVTGAGYQISVDGTATDVVSHFGYMNVCRKVDAAGQAATGTEAGAQGTAADMAFCFGVAAETVTINRDDAQLILCQVRGIADDVNVAASVGVGERLSAGNKDTTNDIGRLSDTDKQIDGNAQGDIQELADSAIVGIALTAAASNKAKVYLLDPLQLAT